MKRRDVLKLAALTPVASVLPEPLLSPALVAACPKADAIARLAPKLRAPLVSPVTEWTIDEDSLERLRQFSARFSKFAEAAARAPDNMPLPLLSVGYEKTPPQ